MGMYGRRPKRFTRKFEAYLTDEMYDILQKFEEIMGYTGTAEAGREIIRRGILASPELTDNSIAPKNNTLDNG